MKPPVPNPRRTARGGSNGAYQPNGSGSPRYIPMKHLELAGVRRSVLVALAIAFLIPVAVAVWALTQIGGSSPKTPAASGKTGGAAAHTAQAASYRHSALFKTLVDVNSSDYAHGYLPPSSCKAMSATMVSCTHPKPIIDEVTFQTFPSLKALYAAYVSRVSTLAQAPFRANFGNCTEGSENGEVAWNHEFHHPSTYPLSMFISGQIKDKQAVGRMFCTLTGGVLYLVWTQNDGRLLAELAGAPHLDAYLWWHNVHHEIAFPGEANMMPSMSGMQGTTSTHSSQTMPGMSGTHSTKAMPSQHGKQTQTMPGMSGG